MLFKKIDKEISKLKIKEKKQQTERPTQRPSFIFFSPSHALTNIRGPHVISNCSHVLMLDIFAGRMPPLGCRLLTSACRDSTRRQPLPLFRAPSPSRVEH